jgi:hypothetical protein
MTEPQAGDMWPVAVLQHPKHLNFRRASGICAVSACFLLRNYCFTVVMAFIKKTSAADRCKQCSGSTTYGGKLIVMKRVIFVPIRKQSASFSRNFLWLTNVAGKDVKIMAKEQIFETRLARKKFAVNFISLLNKVERCAIFVKFEG